LDINVGGWEDGFYMTLFTIIIISPSICLVEVEKIKPCEEDPRFGLKIEIPFSVPNQMCAL